MVQHTVGLVLGLLESGVPADSIQVYDKGDSTQHQNAVRDLFKKLGVWGGLLDNTAVNAPEDHLQELRKAHANLDAFIARANEQGKKVMAIDDGGLIAQGYASSDATAPIDAAIELTISGLNRINDATEISIPIFDLARSQAKQNFGYREIAHSCARQIHAILEGEKRIGRRIALLGYGTLGQPLAHELRASGSVITVYDPDYLRLAVAAEEGFDTHETLAATLRDEPSLIIGASGGNAITSDTLDLIPDGAVLAPFATKDFSHLYESTKTTLQYRVPSWGDVFLGQNGHTFTVLGNGRSLNLYQTDSIAPAGYDLYRAATLVSANYLAGHADMLEPGLHGGLVNELAEDYELYRTYYREYLSNDARDRPRVRRVQARGAACVVGDGATVDDAAMMLDARGYLILRVGRTLATRWPTWELLEHIPRALLDEAELFQVDSTANKHALDVMFPDKLAGPQNDVELEHI